MATKKIAKPAGKAASSKPAGKKAAAKKAASMPSEGRDPQGGLTAKGREFFREKEGANLRPGVQGPADTPEKMVRKGSFLRRHFAHPRGPMKDEKGQPTRLALSAHAWGEPVPQNLGDARKLAATGQELLEKYHELHGDTHSATRREAKKASVKKVTSKVLAKKTAAKKRAVKKTTAKKTAQRTSAAKKPASRKS